MAGLRLGPLLRYVDADSATVWVETDRPCEVRIRCGGGAGGAEHTWQVAGHHYALVPVTGLTPGSETPYEVLLDEQQAWPPPDSHFPPSVIRALPDRAGAPGAAPAPAPTPPNSVSPSDPAAGRRRPRRPRTTPSARTRWTPSPPP